MQFLRYNPGPVAQAKRFTQAVEARTRDIDPGPLENPSAGLVPFPVEAVKDADDGPFLGEYRPIVKGVRDYCGPEASLCEVYCPNKGFLDFTSKRCRVVYACGPKVVKSAEAESGEILVLDCRRGRGES